MRSTERQLRLLIREELMREQAAAIPAMVGNYLYDKYKEYSGEASAQGLSTAQKVGYAASREFLDAGRTGARQVAQGNVDFKFTTYWDLSPAHKKIITDGFDAIEKPAGHLSVLFPPAAVIPVAAGIVGATLKASDGDLAGAVQDLLAALLVAFLTGPLHSKVSNILTRRLGERVSGLIKADPKPFIRGLLSEQGAASLMPELRYAIAKLGGATDLGATVRAGYVNLPATARGAAIIMKDLINMSFDVISKLISEILTTLGTASGRANLVASYNGLKGQVLALLENPVGNPTIIAALAKAEKVLPAA